MKVENMYSHLGNQVPNQFIIRNGRYVYFQSYDTVICRVDKKTDKIVLDPKHNCSNTTIRYRNIFLNSDSKRIKELIKNKVIIVKDLNK